MTDLLTRIREKCIEANPDIQRSTRMHVRLDENDLGKREYKKVYWSRPIHLTDVLAAIEQVQPQSISMDAATTLATNWGGRSKWNLRADDLEKQSPETLEFIGSLLGV